MKINLILFLGTFFIFGLANGQEKTGWNTPMQEIQFVSEANELATMSVDKGYRFADLEYKGKTYRIYFNRDQVSFKKARIVDQETKLELARGKGKYFSGTARFEFMDGEVLKLKKKNYPNGYEVIGPYGILFKVENHGISPVKTLNDKDFIAQAFFVFERIRITQSPPSDDVMVIYTSNYINP
ncbi:MAG: hypothetical protein PSV36_18375 [Algoriphagus sp.]|nr:hypothetical protein [Algoriphagus sp.]